MTLLMWPRHRPPAEPLPVMAPTYVHGPEVSTWVERSDQTRLDMLRWPDLDPVDWVRNGAGQSPARAYLDDPGIWPLFDNGEPINVEDEDLQLAHYRNGACVWRGPLVANDYAAGRLELQAFTGEWYVPPQHLAGPLVNWVGRAPDGTSAGYFDEQPGLERWHPDDGITAETVYGPESVLWMRPASMSVEATTLGQKTYVDIDLPYGENANYADVIVRVRVPSGVRVPGSDGDGAIQIGWTQHYTAEVGSGAYPTRGAPRPLYLPDTYRPGGGHTYAILRVPSVPGVKNRHRVNLVGGVGGPVYYGEVEGVRDENVSALADQDVGVLHASLFRHIAPLMGPQFTRRNRTVGIPLTDDVRHVVVAHPTAATIMSPWTQVIDWWVEHVNGKVVLCAGPRGRDVATLVLTSENVGDLRARRSAAEAINELLVGSVDTDTRTREEFSARRAGAPIRLPGRKELPGGHSVRNLVGWAEREVDLMASRTEVTGVPVGDGGSWSGDILAEVRPADRVRGHVIDGPLLPDGSHRVDFGFTATIESLTWDPKTDRVTPGWAA